MFGVLFLRLAIAALWPLGYCVAEACWHGMAAVSRWDCIPSDRLRHGLTDTCLPTTPGFSLYLPLVPFLPRADRLHVSPVAGRLLRLGVAAFQAGTLAVSNPPHKAVTLCAKRPVRRGLFLVGDRDHLSWACPCQTHFPDRAGTGTGQTVEGAGGAFHERAFL